MRPPSRETARRRAGDGALRVTVLPGDAGVSLSGDADTVSQVRLRAALALLRPGDGAAIHLELARLRFIDIAGVRELVRLSQGDPPRRLILHDPPRTLRRLLCLVWPGADVEIRDSTPGEQPRQHWLAWGFPGA